MTPLFDMPVLASAIVFISILLLIMGILQAYRLMAQKGKVIEKIRSAGESVDISQNDMLLINRVNSSKGRFQSILHVLGFVGKRVAGEKTDEYAASRIKFFNAGIRRKNAAHIFWGAKIVFSVGLMLLFLMMQLMFFKGMTFTIILLMCVGFAYMGLYLPEIWLDLKIAKRKEQIFKGLPDALDLMVVCVEAGMDLNAAINKVAEELYLTCPPLSEEFKIMSLETRAGKSRQSALRNLGMRVGLDEMNNLVTMLIQTDKFGTSSAQALRVYSDTSRAKRFSIAEEKAAKLGVKILFPLIFFIMPAVFVVLVGPGLIRVYETLIAN
ncbi:type II secretion system F family protein [Desulfococcus sp.]|jgi:tight adherence protein C|uniref:type II secretion system F family protein n=1 Tax=Desulfococcus sp. TaxID=2025834 RepID=UPI003D0F327A